MDVNELFFESDMNDALQKVDRFIDESYIELIYNENGNEDDNEDDITEEQQEKLIDRIKKFIKEILEKIKDFIDDIVTKIKTAKENEKLNKRLDDLKEKLAKNRQVGDKKINIFDMHKYKKYYSDYIKVRAKLVRELYTRDFKTMEEFREFESKALSKIKEYEEGLTDTEKYELSLTVNQAIAAAEDIIENRESSIKDIEKDSVLLTEEVEEEYERRVKSIKKAELMRATGKFTTKFLSISFTVARIAIISVGGMFAFAAICGSISDAIGKYKINHDDLDSYDQITVHKPN